MGRLSQLLQCPACGEPMKVSKGTATQKVCCPHCRQNVVLDRPTEPPPSFGKPAEGAAGTDLTLPVAASQMEEILLLCKEKRAAMENLQEEIAELEIRAQALAYWLQTQEITPGETTHSGRALSDLQARLFDQLQPLEGSRIAIHDCSSQSNESLAQAILLTFEAFGWTVGFQLGELAPSCGEEITFVVAPGPVTYPVAAVYIALQSAGIRLHSRIDLEQPAEYALLCVHQISNVPKLLPTPKNRAAQNLQSDFRKTA